MTQTTMPLAEVLALQSGDFGIPVSEILPLMEGRPCTQCSGDCDDHILAIAEDMEVNGWNGRPIYVDAHCDTLRNGHHRTMAAWLVGLTEVQVTDKWSESDDDW